MKIGIVATHSFPIPFPDLHTGDVVILNLAKTLEKLGHEVTMFAPEGTDFHNVNPMRASFGKYPPSSEQCEAECFELHKDSLLNQDIVHDFSVSKRIVQNLNAVGCKNTTCTLMGGAWTQSTPPRNLVVWSQTHRDRVVRGATDYENTPTPDLAGPPQKPISDAKVVNGGIDTEFYHPNYVKEDFYLWMGRWLEPRGYRLAIDIAKKTGIRLILAGEHPDRELFENQKQCALEAVELAKGLPNVFFEWLPTDPNHHVSKRELYRRAKAFLYTVAFNEPFGLSQAEALSCGTPVIGTYYGSIPEVVAHRSTGIICANNVKSFASAISDIDTISPQMCRTECVKKFDISVMAKNYIKKYNAILSGETW